jgi:hypothetical protein
MKIFHIVALFVAILFSAPAAFAQTTPQPPLVLANKEDTVKLGSPLYLRAQGDLTETVRKELASATGVVTLYLDGIRMENLKARHYKDDASGLTFAFDLVRNADDEKNRKSWDALFAIRHAYLMDVLPSITIGKDAQRQIDANETFKLYVAAAEIIYGILAVALAIILATFIVLVRRKSPMLLDTETGHFSLGKSQMMFWGLIVVLTFFGVWLLTTSMERIPAQALVLLGISAGTGLGAVLMGNTKTSSPPTGFWSDIINDGTGPSFHRLQVVIWTLVLGAVFIRAVMQTISMPEFSETLLVLMGISNGTYLGFKIAEK